MKKIKIAVVFGTRPEAIKMAPVIKELERQSAFFETKVIVTAQHREMLDQVLQIFNIQPDYDLNIMKTSQTLSDITSSALKGIEEILLKDYPDMVLVHGDTSTSFAAALAAYYQKIPVGHIEAGLRTYDKYFPFPEEANRQLIDMIADLYFVPTEQSKRNLLKEGKNEELITVTGNTVIDAVHITKKLEVEHEIIERMKSEQDKKWIVLTMHRRENYGIAMENVFKAVRDIVDTHEEVAILMPVHMSPTVQQMANEILNGHNRIHLVSPLEVNAFHKIISLSYLVLTDSGGLQEEAPALNIPVLVLREKTERPEGLEAGTLKVIGTGRENVVASVAKLLNDKEVYDAMSQAINPYGDGHASIRIIKDIKEYFEERLGGYPDDTFTGV